MIQRNINARFGIDAGYGIVCQAEGVCIDARILCECLCACVVIDLVVVDFISYDPVDDPAVLCRCSRIAGGEEGDRSLQLPAR